MLLIQFELYIINWKWGTKMSYTLGWIRRILIWINIAIVLFMAIYFGGAYFGKSDYKKNMVLGIQYETSKSYVASYRQFKYLVETYPEDPAVLLHFAKACYSRGKFNEMQETLIKLKKYKAGVSIKEDYKDFEKILNQEAMPSNELAKIIENSKSLSFEENVKALNDYLKKNDRDFLGYFTLGNIYMEQEDYLKSIDAYKKVLLLKKNMVPAILNLATAYRETGYYSMAEYIAVKAFESNPGSSQAYVVLSRIRLDMYDDARAVEFAKKASTDLDPDGLDSKAMLAVVAHYANLQSDSLELLSELKKDEYFDYKNLKDIVEGKLNFR